MDEYDRFKTHFIIFLRIEKRRKRNEHVIAQEDPELDRDRVQFHLMGDLDIGKLCFVKTYYIDVK